VALSLEKTSGGIEGTAKEYCYGVRMAPNLRVNKEVRSAARWQMADSSLGVVTSPVAPSQSRKIENMFLFRNFT
jgi:hypothetical protein